VGNWTMSGWTADAKADMLTASPGSKTYTYTPRGSLKEVYANQQQAQTFGYDAEGLLTFKSDLQQSRVSLMGWDHAGRRIELTANGGTPWRFIYDPTASVPAVLVEDLNGTPQAFYVREPDGRLIAREAGESLQYCFFDLLGSTILMAPAAENNPTDRFYYTPWGETVTTGARASAVGTTANPYRFVGSLGYYTHHQDANLADWMQLGVRFYEPELGRFERRDPVNSPLTQSYLYANVAPLRFVDPSGKWPGGIRWRQCMGQCLSEMLRTQASRVLRCSCWLAPSLAASGAAVCALIALIEPELAATLPGCLGLVVPGLAHDALVLCAAKEFSPLAAAAVAAGCAVGCAGW